MSWKRTLCMHQHELIPSEIYWMLFPCLQKQQRLVNPQDQTQKMHHLDESDLQMWNRSKLNCRSVTYLWLSSGQIELNITFTNTSCIVLQKWILHIFFFCVEEPCISQTMEILHLLRCFLNPLFPDLSLANSIMTQGGGDLLGEHHNLPQGTQFGSPWAQWNLANLCALVSFSHKLQWRKRRARVCLCGMWAPDSIPASGLMAKACPPLQSVSCTIQNWSLQHFFS